MVTLTGMYGRIGRRVDEDMLIFVSNVINAAGGWKWITDVKKAREKIENWNKRNSDEWAIASELPIIF